MGVCAGLNHINLLSLESSALKAMNNTLDMDIQEAEVNIEEEASRNILEAVFSEDFDKITELSWLNKINDILIRSKKFPDFDIQRKVIHFCNSILSPIVQNIKDEEGYPNIFANMSDSEKNINDAMLNITPHQGCLQPFECSLVNFYIRPPPQTFIKATVACRILGGAEEKLEISAICGNIAFDLDKGVIEFGNQV
ncbi:hypothetical protein HHI36_005603 [Cryptolaemus montrouzieri]|uniref:Uncharacterized protein n=1 Tax=Cryptolaemus montrouzieri TaxID=559131 RepID=A0ABD2NUP8_9CUCU